jgi:hypothetical protein
MKQGAQVMDNLVFKLLVEAGAVDPFVPIYELARRLNITPSKARNLLFQWQLRNAGDEQTLRDQLARSLAKVRFAKDGTLLSFGIESPLLKEELVARLKRLGTFADSSFTRDIVRLPVDQFVEFLDVFLDNTWKNTMVKRLVHDKQLPDTSFKGLAKAALRVLAKKVGEETAGKAAEQAVDHVSDFLQGLLHEDEKQVRRSIKGLKTEELIEV